MVSRSRKIPRLLVVMLVLVALNFLAASNRPVARKSNRHNVIFQPPSLPIPVADADQGRPACHQPYRTSPWADLFSAVPFS